MRAMVGRSETSHTRRVLLAAFEIGQHELKEVGMIPRFRTWPFWVEGSERPNARDLFVAGAYLKNALKYGRSVSLYLVRAVVARGAIVWVLLPHKWCELPPVS